jgi:hypothetical protein
VIKPGIIGSRSQAISGQVRPGTLQVASWLDADPRDELAGEMGAELTAAPVHPARCQRDYLGWGNLRIDER